MILMFIVCVIHQISASNYIFQGSKEQVKRYIYSSECFENYGSQSIVARLEEAHGLIRPNCPQITFELPAEMQWGKRARITINQSLPANSDLIFLINSLSDRYIHEEYGDFFLGCWFKGTSRSEQDRLALHGGYFGTVGAPPKDESKGLQPKAKVAPVENVVSTPPVFCSFEVGMEKFKTLFENTHENWRLAVDSRMDGTNVSYSITNLKDILFSKYPQDSLPIKKHGAYIGDDCVSSNVNCFYAPQCFKNNEYEPNCAAIFIVEYHEDNQRDYVLITMKSMRSDVQRIRYTLKKHKLNEDLGRVDHSLRLMHFDCIFDEEKQNYENFVATSDVSKVKISSNPKFCSFSIKLGNGQEPNDIFDNTAWEMSIDSESYYQIIKPQLINWKG